MSSAALTLPNGRNKTWQEWPARTRGLLIHFPTFSMGLIHERIKKPKGGRIRTCCSFDTDVGCIYALATYSTNKYINPFGISALKRCGAFHTAPCEASRAPQVQGKQREHTVQMHAKNSGLTSCHAVRLQSWQQAASDLIQSFQAHAEPCILTNSTRDWKHTW